MLNLALEARYRACIDAINSRDSDNFASFVADDAVNYGPYGLPVPAKQGISFL